MTSTEAEAGLGTIFRRPHSFDRVTTIHRISKCKI